MVASGESAMLVIRAWIWMAVAICSVHTAASTEYLCDSVNDVRVAMDVVQPGDEIVVSFGTYTAGDVAKSGTSSHFLGEADGTSSHPIVLRSAVPNSRATLSGDDIETNYVLGITGNYWIVKDLVLAGAQKGVVLDNANHVQIVNCEVCDIGLEAIHVRDGSDYTLIEDCYVHDTGLYKPGFGEGIYIGSDRKVWGDPHDPSVAHTTVSGCTIGPRVAGEPFDIKEGTEETIVEHCVIDATGISGDNYADSFIDLKGTRSYIRFNIFYRNGASELDKGVAVIDRDVAKSSYEHAVHGNIFFMDTGSGNMVEAYGGTSGVYAWNNTRFPAGDEYNSGVIEQCCPPWYDPTSPTATPAPIQTDPPLTPAPTQTNPLTPAPTTGIEVTSAPTFVSSFGWTAITYDDFEDGWGSYISGGGDSRFYSDGTNAHQGSNAIEIRDSSDGSFFTHTTMHNVVAYTDVLVHFWFLAEGVDNNEEFWLQYLQNEETQWITAKKWVHEDDFVNGNFYAEFVIIDSTAINNIMVRFRSNGSSNSDSIYIDQVEFAGKSEDISAPTNAPTDDISPPTREPTEDTFSPTKSPTQETPPPTNTPVEETSHPTNTPTKVTMAPTMPPAFILIPTKAPIVSPAPTFSTSWTTITFDDFETDWGSYTSGGQDAKFYTETTYAHGGDNAIEIRDNSNESFFTHTVAQDVVSYDELMVRFWFWADGVDNTEEFLLQYLPDGQTQWITAKKWVHNNDFVNGAFYEEVFIIDSTAMNSIRLCFRCNGSSNSDSIYIDEVELAGNSQGISTPTKDPTTFISAPTPPTSWTTVTYDDFETDWGSYTSGGQDAKFYTESTYAHGGDNAIEIRDDSDESFFTHTDAQNVASYDELMVRFWFWADGVDNTEEFLLQYLPDGQTRWITAKKWVHNNDFVNGAFYEEVVIINSSNISNIKIRFRCNGSSNTDSIYIDEVELAGKV